MDDLDLGATIKGFSAGQKLFNRYTLARMLGRGGMGVVWLARDEELGRETALKFLPEVVAADRSAVEDMKREVRRAIDLAHPHIVKIHDFITDGRTAAVSMEYITGGTLSSLRIDQPGQVFTVEQLLPWLIQLCGALDYAHQDAEVVHRDLKPANLMVDARGRLRVLDFGIAASISDSVSRVSQQAGSSGTPVYMSPQQMMGENPAVTDDLYAVGATLYELLTGKPPFHSGNIILQVQNKAPPPLNERRQALNLGPVPPAWEQTIAACLAKEPAERPQSGAELLRRIGGEVMPPAGKATTRATTARPVSATPSPPALAGPAPGELPGAGLHWARRWLLAPVVGALPTTFVMSMCVAGMIQAFNTGRQETVQIFLLVWLASTILGSGIFLLLIAIRRPWRSRGSWGVVILGALTGGTVAAIFTVTSELSGALSLGGTALGAGVGAMSGWWLYRIAARATFRPSGPIPGLRPGIVYGAQAVLLLVATWLFFTWLPEAAKAAEDLRTEQVRTARIAQWTPKIDEAYRLVFDREPTAAERQKYIQRMENNTWWSADDLRRDMRDSEEGRNGGRLLVPQEFKKIQDAINVAKPGNIVVVGPGTYEENLYLGAGITLRGAGRDQVFVQSAATTNTLNVTESSRGAKISGFTFRHSSRTEAERRYTPVWIGAEDVEFWDNTVENGDGPGLVLNKAKNCLVHDNVVRGAQWDGVYVQAGTSGRIVGNTLRDNRQSGIQLTEQPGALEVSDNTIHGNGDVGLSVTKGDGVKIIGNTAYNNGLTHANGGIGIFSGAGRPVLRNNRAYSNKGPGIWWVDSPDTNPPPVIEGGNVTDGKDIPYGATKNVR